MMTKHSYVHGMVIAALVWGGVILSTTRLSAQLVSPSATALGLAENYVAAARGYSAVYWNPAGLGLSGTGRLSLVFLPLRGNAAISAIGVAELARMQGEVLDAETKADWLAQIQGANGLLGGGLGSITYVAGNVGRIGFQVSTTAAGDVALSAAAAEMLLYGNRGPGGAPRMAELDGSSFGVTGISTAAVAVGQPVSIWETRIAVGASLRYSMGHYLLAGRDEEAFAGADPLEVRIRFPTVQTESDLISRSAPYLHNNGQGVGLDLGLGWENEYLGIGVVARNLVRYFRWDASALRYRPGVILIDHDGNESETGERPISEASPAFMKWLNDRGVPRSYALGVVAQPSPWISLTSDLQLEESPDPGSGQSWRYGAGMEVFPLTWLPLRTGFAWGTRGPEYAAGLGFRLGSVEVSAGGMVRGRARGNEATGAFHVAFRP